MPQDPQALSIVGEAHTRYREGRFGVRQADRLFHFYVLGQTGTGKSTLLGNLIAQDAEAGRGYCLIDPHGDLAFELSQSMPGDLIYWDVADASAPYGYNPIANVSELYRPIVASGLIETFKRQWADAWGVRMEHLLRQAILALLTMPKADLRDIVRLFLDKDFRSHVIARVDDPQVLTFWRQEYPNMNYKNAIDGLAPIANKLGAFLAHPVVRKAICEPEKPLRFRRLMDEGTGIIINLSKGRLGTDTANVLGGLLVSSLMHAGFSRHDTPESERRPFYLYVDEFHAFTSSAFASLLSEVRKYGLGLILAHQHSQQTDRETFDAILGNVGSMMILRCGIRDAPLMGRQLGGVDPLDLTMQPNHKAHIRLMVEGSVSPVFTADLDPPRWLTKQSGGG